MVEVIIVSYNTKELLKDCLTSVFTNCVSSKTPYCVTVVDNASVDGTVEMVRGDFPQVKLITNKSNVGFAKANNQGMAASEADYFFLLNSDAMLLSDAINLLVQHMNEHPAVAIAGCKLILQDGTRQVGDAGYKPSLASFAAFAFFLSKMFPKSFKGFYLNDKSIAEHISVDWVSGAAMFVRRRFFQQVGGLSESYFMYAEDTEWGLRAKECGWQVHYLPQIVVKHLMGASGKEETPTKWLQSSYHLLKSTTSNLEAKCAIAILGIGFLIRCILYFLMGEVRGNDVYKIKVGKMAVWAGECFALFLMGNLQQTRKPTNENRH